MPALRRSAALGAALSGLLVVIPASAGAKKSTVRIKMNSKAQTLTGPVKLQAVPRGKKPRKVTFAIDGKRSYVARQAPYRFGGAGGNLDPRSLQNGKHRITVRAYFGSRRVVKATTLIRVRRQWVPAVAPADPAVPAAPPTEQVIVTTTLPSAGGGESSSEAAAWDGSADRGFTPWAQIQDGLRDASFGSSATSIVNSPTSPGHKAFKFDVNGGASSNGPRAELADGYQLREGMTWWFGDVLYIPSNPSRNIGWSPGHHTVLQFKNAGTGSPPLNLDIRDWGGGKAGLYAQEEAPGGLNYRLLVPESTLYDRPIPIEIRVKFSSNPTVGEYEVWVSGQRVAGPVKMATLYPGLTSGLKQGQYGETAGSVVYWHGAKRGSTRASVMR